MNKQAYITHMSNIKTRHQKLNSYRVMNSHRDNSDHTAESPDPLIQIKSIYKSLELLLLDFLLIS